jgi:hypothetical protein
VRQTGLSTHESVSAESPCAKQPFPRTGQFRQSRRASNSPFCARGGLRQGCRASNSTFHARDGSGRVAVRKTGLSTHGSVSAESPCAKPPFPRTGRFRQSRRAQNSCTSSFEKPSLVGARDGSGRVAVRKTVLSTHGSVSAESPCVKPAFPRTGTA